MTQPNTPPELLPFNPDSIPQALKDLPRWAPWKAVWQEKRGKYDKVPFRADAPQYGLSSARPQRWSPFDVALAAYHANPGTFSGLGIVLTGLPGVVGTDLDRCVKDGAIAPWAQKIVDDLSSYTEISPSGRGLRIFNTGAQEVDWTNHDIGIEVYGGNDARFLTVSGQHLSTTPLGVVDAPEGVLPALQTQYAKEKAKATVIDLNMPDILDDLTLPDLAGLGLPYKVVDFLVDGTITGDRSDILHASGVALYSAGLDDATVFSLLVNNEHAMEVALDHRRQDPERANMYLWREQCLKAKPKARAKSAGLDEFDDMVERKTDTGKPATEKKLRFHIERAGAFSQSKAVSWLIKGLLPQAEVAAIIGESGSGKTFFVLDMLLAIATGAEWRGRKVKQGAVLYICAEGAGGFRTRLKAYALHHDIDLDTLPFYVLGDAPNMMEKGDVKDLLESIRALPEAVSVICADTWAQVTAGANENSGEDMGRALGHCKALKKATNAMITLVAHTGKVAERGMRGWSGVKGALDAEITVEKSDKYHSATITKMKDGSDEGEEFAFTLKSVVLGQDEDGDDVTSCVVEAGQSLSREKRKIEPKGVWQKLVLRLAMDMTDLPGEVHTHSLVEAAVNQMPEEEGKRDRRRDQATRALEALVAANRVSTADGKVVVL